MAKYSSYSKYVNFINKYKKASNASTGSEVDANANVKIRMLQQCRENFLKGI